MKQNYTVDFSRAGTVDIDLIDGQLCYKHDDITDGLNISHILWPKTSNNLFFDDEFIGCKGIPQDYNLGYGYKLNIQQYIKRINDSAKTIIYLDADGKKTNYYKSLYYIKNNKCHRIGLNDVHLKLKSGFTEYIGEYSLATDYDGNYIYVDSNIEYKVQEAYFSSLSIDVTEPILIPNKDNLNLFEKFEDGYKGNYKTVFYYYIGDQEIVLDDDMVTTDSEGNPISIKRKMAVLNTPINGERNIDLMFYSNEGSSWRLRTEYLKKDTNSSINNSQSILDSNPYNPNNPKQIVTSHHSYVATVVLSSANSTIKDYSPLQSVNVYKELDRYYFFANILCPEINKWCENYNISEDNVDLQTYTIYLYKKIIYNNNDMLKSYNKTGEKILDKESELREVVDYINDIQYSLNSCNNKLNARPFSYSNLHSLNDSYTYKLDDSFGISTIEDLQRAFEVTSNNIENHEDRASREYYHYKTGTTAEDKYANKQLISKEYTEKLKFIQAVSGFIQAVNNSVEKNISKNTLNLIKEQLNKYLNDQKILKLKEKLETELDKLINEEKNSPSYYLFKENGDCLAFDYYGKLVDINGYKIIYENNKIIQVMGEEDKIHLFFEYDSGYLKSITDSVGNKINYEYNGSALKKIIYPDGTDTSFALYTTYIDSTSQKTVWSLSIADRNMFYCNFYKDNVTANNYNIFCEKRWKQNKISKSGVTAYSESPDLFDAIYIVKSGNRITISDSAQQETRDFSSDYLTVLSSKKILTHQDLDCLNRTYELYFNNSETYKYYSKDKIKEYHSTENQYFTEKHYYYNIKGYLTESHDKDPKKDSIVVNEYSNEELLNKSTLTIAIKSSSTYINKNALVTSYFYDSDNKIVRKESYNYTYDTSNNLIPTGKYDFIIEYFYDKNGLLVSEQKYFVGDSSSRSIMDYTASKDDGIIRNYDLNTGDLLSVTKSDGENENSVNYSYKNGYITNLNNGDLNIDYYYRQAGQIERIDFNGGNLRYLQRTINRTVPMETTIETLYNNNTGYKKVIGVNYENTFYLKKEGGVLSTSKKYEKTFDKGRIIELKDYNTNYKHTYTYSSYTGSLYIHEITSISNPANIISSTTYNYDNYGNLMDNPTVIHLPNENLTHQYSMIYELGVNSKLNLSNLQLMSTSGYNHYLNCQIERDKTGRISGYNIRNDTLPLRKEK
jgi:hypothetical protein